MRVISGKYRGRVLAGFDGVDIRPTSDRAKEALFSILQNKLASCDFLDMYCGTGSIGIEALSRGASSCYFVDNNRTSVLLTNQNLKQIGIELTAQNIDASYAVKKLSQEGKSFDVIFLDPPYGESKTLSVIEAIAKAGILKDDGILILETDSENKQNLSALGLAIYDERKYGKAKFTFYKKAEVLEVL